MTDLRDILAFDAALAVGDAVEVRWTNCGLAYREPGRVTKLNACSVRVAIDNDVAGHWSRHDADKVLYPAGHEISVPRCTFRSIERWSWNNGVFPHARGETASESFRRNYPDGAAIHPEMK